MKITLEYNARNQTANRIVDIILSMDRVFKVETHEKQPRRLTRKALQEAEKGGLTVCKSYEEYLNKPGRNA